MLETISETRGFEILACDEELPVGDPSTLPPPPSSADAASLSARWLYHTSGSTADPKGVWHTDASIIAGSYGFVAGYTPTSDDVYPMAFPITHIGGAAILVASMLTGLRLVLMDTFDAERSPLVMAEHGATFLGSAIPFFQAYMAAQRKHGPEKLFPGLRSCVGGGAPNSPELHREVQEVLGGRGVCSSWGLTEFPIATAPSLDDTDEQLSTTEGRPSPQVEIRVARPDGSACEPGEAGELCLRGPQLFRGYADADADARRARRPGLPADRRSRHGVAVGPRADHRATQGRGDPQRREHLRDRGGGRAAQPRQDRRRRRHRRARPEDRRAVLRGRRDSPTASTPSRSPRSPSTAGRSGSPTRRSPSNSRSSTWCRATRWARSGSRSCASSTPRRA